MGNCPTCSLEYANKSLDPMCNGKRMWTSFLLLSFAVFITGGILSLIYQQFQNLSARWHRRRHLTNTKNIRSSRQTFSDDDDPNDHHLNWLNQMKEWENNIISGQTKMGKTFVTIIFLCSIASLVLYCIDTKYNKYMESCRSFYKSMNMKIDLGLNIVFLIYFILRLTAAQDKQRFWFSLYSFVDIFTIPPSFLSFYLNRSWTGLRFLRALPMMNVPDILQYMGVIERPRPIRIIQLASQFIAVWFAVAGFVHLAENSGDFFCNFCNSQEIDIFNSVYFIIITMTTVGYGDISCKTYIGKLFVLLALISGLAVFATMIPEFSNLFSSKEPYSSGYVRVKGKRHVIICGHITHHSLTSFLRDFLHKGREQVDELDVLIIDKKTPDLEMEALLKRYSTKLQYFVGSIMNIADLKRVQADKATACLIIANKECADPSNDDSANIMRVISLKNLNHRIRILLQLLRYHNKLNVVSIPGWSTDNDEIICIGELKLGLIGMSCVVPGFSTMMTNIFRMSSYNAHMHQRTSSTCFCSEDDQYEKSQSWPWRQLYHRGAGITMYLEEMSPFFNGKTFVESALICFKLGVMLVAVEMKQKDEDGNIRLVVNIVPCDDCIILPESRAFIVCMSSEEANRIEYYCSICYPIINDLTESQLKNMRKCTHLEQMNLKLNKEVVICKKLNNSEENEYAIVPILDNDIIRPLISSQSERTFSPCLNRSNTLLDEDISNFDSTGMFYYTSPRNIEDAVLDKNILRKQYNRIHEEFTNINEITSFKQPFHFRDHIVVCLHADKSSSSIGLRNFVMPLRASSLRRHELSVIIFITDLHYIKKEWDMIATFPDIYILNGSPNNPYNLKLISIDDCRQCVIMSTIDRGNLDTYLVDKSSVLCALSIRQIQIKRTKLLQDSNLNQRNNSIQTITTNKPMRHNRMHTLTALTIDSNVQYVEQGHTDEVDLQFFLTTPFASGAAFADSVLDCILSCAYYNANTINLLRNILMGGIDLQLEEILAEGEPFVGCKKPEMVMKRKRARVTILSIHDLIPDIDKRSIPITFSSLYCESLERHRMLVMGIYRLFNILIQNDPMSSINQSNDDQKRIVIYYPPYNYHIHPSDMVYVIQHSHLQSD